MKTLAQRANTLAVGYLETAAHEKTTAAERQACGTLALAAAVLMLGHILEERLGKVLDSEQVEMP
jgi:hypothetical protein